ncbi:MAG TPA: DUF6755 family protein [Chthonomonadales bacterium]|nr:DUF6755 family protein [Chthonomonadales bacterium]
MTRKEPPFADMEHRSQAITTIMLLVLVLFVIQLWLITIALEEYLAARHTLAVSTFLASGFCFLSNLGLLKYLYDVDRKRED